MINKTVSLLLLLVLCAAASDMNASSQAEHYVADDANESNISAPPPRKKNLAVKKHRLGTDTQCIECINSASAENNGINWFFYRDVVRGMDSFQHYISHKVTVFSSNIDHKFSRKDEDEERIETLPGQLAKYENDEKVENTYAISKGIGAFFKDETYLDATNRSYVRLRGGYEYNQRGDNKFLQRISARIKLPKTSDRFQLFIGSEGGDSSAIAESPAESEKHDIGVKYFVPTMLDLLDASLSVGFSGIKNPYIKGRIQYPVFIRSVLFRPVQQVMYSAENEFQEWTSFYFDRRTSGGAMKRVLLERSTQSGANGMNYMAQFSYFNTQSHGVGLNQYISINGRTEDLADAYANGEKPQEGVYSYAAGMIWRQKLGRDYLFYQLQPIVDFHEQYDYKANAIFKVTLELYFGKY